MSADVLIKMIFGVIGGLGIFLLGMKNMSEGMQAVAGERLRRLINAVTNNRLMACGVGTAITCLIQSSSITTVMVVGMVNASLMTLKQGIGVILGANIGTTITGWVLVLKVGKYGLPILGISAIFYLFAKKDRLRYTASFFLGLGMVFFGLSLMKSGFSPLRDMPEFHQWFAKFSPHSYFGIWKCCLVGAILTAVVQSSSATLGITISLASIGVIDYPTAAALVLGENIGTTITAMLASIGASTNARRASMAHLMINIIGVLWITAIFPLYTGLVIKFIGTDPSVAVVANGVQSFPYAERAIAATHTGFNVVNMIVFMPFVGLLGALLHRLVPDKIRKETPHLTYLDLRMLDTPAISIEQSHKEIVRMGDGVVKMLTTLKEIVVDGRADREKEDKIFNRENVLDVVQKEISEFLSKILSGNVAKDVVAKGRCQLRMADEYESVSDYVANILKLILKARDAKLEISDEGKAEILDLNGRVLEYLKFINTGVEEQNPDILNKATTKGDAITHTIKDYRAKHLERMAEGRVSPLKSLIYMDMLNSYRRIKDHALNIAEAQAGVK